MRKLVLQMQLSIDGFVGDSNGGVDWIFDSFDSAASAWVVERLGSAGVHAMGSRTFADMKSHWPTSTEPYAAPMNAIPKVVFARGELHAATTTRALTDAAARHPAARAPGDDASWTNPRVAAGDLADEVRRLKQEPGGEILAHGGVSLARSLIAGRLVDEFRLLVHPIALGRGLPLFSDVREPLRFELVSSERFATGLIANVLRPR